MGQEQVFLAVASATNIPFILFLLVVGFMPRLDSLPLVYPDILAVIASLLPVRLRFVPQISTLLLVL